MDEDDASSRELYEQIVAAFRGIVGQRRRVSWYEMQVRVRILKDVEPPVAQVFERLKLLDLADAARNRWATALDAYDAALRDGRR